MGRQEVSLGFYGGSGWGGENELTKVYYHRGLREAIYEHGLTRYQDLVTTYRI
jgi:hypothetical protein